MSKEDKRQERIRRLVEKALNPKQPTWSQLGVVYLTIVIASIPSALLTAWALSTVWGWFLAGAYGDGPSMGQWYGIAALVQILTLHASRKDYDVEEFRDSPVTYTLGKTIEYLVSIPFIVLCVSLVGFVMGWK